MHLHRLSLPLLVAGLFAAPAHATDYRLQDISGGGQFQVATAINNVGQVTGGSDHDGFFYSAGTGLLRIGAPGGAAVHAWGVDINNAGQVVGRWQDGDVTRGFVYTTANGLRDLGHAGLSPVDINEWGLVVGMATPAPNGRSQAFYGTLENGVNIFQTPAPMVSVVGNVDFGSLVVANREAPEQGEGRTLAGWMVDGGGADLAQLPDGVGSYGEDTTGDSSVVGYLQLPGDGGLGTVHHAFAYTAADGYIDLTSAMPEPAASSFASAINERGQVIGGGEWADGSAFNFLYDLTTGTFRDLASLLDPLSSAGWSALQLNELNDLGQIVGTGLFQGQQRAFLLSPMAPVPEPGVVLMLALGGVLVVGVARRRRASYWASSGT